MSVTLEDMRIWCLERFEEVTEGPLSLVGLEVFSPSGAESTIHSINSKVSADKWTADCVAQMMDVVATRHARGLPGVSQFQLSACYGPSGRPSRFLPFMRIGSPAPGSAQIGGMIPGEPTGALAQAIRMAEVTFQGNMALLPQLLATQGSIIERSNRRMAELEHEVREGWLAMRGMLKELTDGQVGVMREQRMNMIVGEGFKLMPIALPALTGQRLSLPEHVERESFDNAILDLCSEEDLLRMIEKFNAKDPARAALVVNYLARVRERRDIAEKEKKDMAVSRGPVSRAQAAADAAGDVIHPKELAKVTPPKPPALKPTIEITREHRLSLDASRVLAEGLISGIGLDGLTFEWVEPNLLAFQIDQGMGSGVRGVVHLREGALDVKIALPMMLKMAAGGIGQKINAALDEKLGQ